MARQQPLWSRAALVVALGVLGSGACWFSASAATNVTASQLASGSSGVQGCTGSAHAAWTPNPIATASGTAITGGTLTLTGDCIIPGGAATVVAQNGAGTALATAQVTTANATQTFTFAQPVDTAALRNVTITIRST